MNKEELQFLALLVHRGYLDRGQAEEVLPRLKAGEDLDDLLAEVFGWSDKHIERLRRTRAGEAPEIPGFEILGQLGSGGTSDVFRARDKKSGRAMALKILNRPSTLNAGVRKAFIGEARLLERLEHPGLVKGFGVAKSGDTFFNRLELIEGRTLLELLDDGHRFDETQALRAVLETAEVLRYLHEEDVVHRDVKPGNIMLTSSGRFKLIDLGFAAAPDEASPDDAGVGTVQYLSPEQAMGGASADIRSDVYSLGVTLFHLVVGRLPFESSSDEETLRMQVMESMRSPELKSRGLSPHLHYFIEKMMAKEAEHRYQTWDELMEDIREQIEGRESLDYSRDSRKRGAGARRRRL